MIVLSLDGVRRVIDRYRAVWEAERATLDATLELTKHPDHMSPGHGYWEAERGARRRYEAAVDVLKAFESELPPR